MSMSPQNVQGEVYGEAEEADLASPSSSQFTPSISRFEPSIWSDEKTRLGRPVYDFEDDLELDEISKEVLQIVDADSEGAGDSQLSTALEEKAVLRKLDRRVVLFIALLYLVSYLDRSNIGNARIAGLETDLSLSSDQYDWLLTAFYITYVAFEWMALLFRVLRPSRYLAICTLAWGVLASLQSVSSSFEQMLVLRALLGISEAAFAGVPFYLSFFFRSEELASRVGVFIAAAPLATSFASSLAWVITWVAERFHVWAPWRLLFVVEGCPSIFIAYFVWNYLPDGPGTAAFLNPRERRIAISRLDLDPAALSQATAEKQSVANPLQKPRLRSSEILKTLRNPNSYLTALMFFCANVAYSSAPVFLPTLINSMGFSTLSSQALSAPPFLVAFLAVLITAYASDRYRSRSPFLIAAALLAAAGYATSLLAALLRAPTWLRYLGFFPAAAGFFTCVMLIVTWTLNNARSDSGRGAGIALLQYFGQMGPFLGTRLYPEKEGPLYIRGLAVCCVCMLAVAGLAGVLRWRLARENRRVLERRNKRREGNGLLGEEAQGLLAEEGSAWDEQEDFIHLL